MDRSKSAKRKLPFAGIQRRVRARKDEGPELDLEEQFSESEADGANASEASDDDDNDDDASQSDPSGSESEDESDEESTKGNPSLAVAQVSFGALAKAQASLPNARSKKQGDGDDGSKADSDGDSYEEEERHKDYKKPPSRSNKHAPMEQSSKRAVTRKREVVPVHRQHARDPRFGPLGGAFAGAAGGAHSEDGLRRNYSFLDEYRDNEMAQLKATIKKTKDVAAKEKLQRALASMQSRKQAQQRKDAERNVIEEHRKQEKELVKQGKTPFYLKKSEQKKRVLMDRFASMKKGQVDRAIMRRRKKVDSKERRDMPFERRER